MWSRVTVTATEIQVGGTEPATDAPKGAGRAQLAQIGWCWWVTAAIAVNVMGTAIWMLSAHVNEINLHTIEAMRLYASNSSHPRWASGEGAPLG